PELLRRLTDGAGERGKRDGGEDECRDVAQREVRDGPEGDERNRDRELENVAPSHGADANKPQPGRGSSATRSTRAGRVRPAKGALARDEHRPPASPGMCTGKASLPARTTAEPTSSQTPRSRS